MGLDPHQATRGFGLLENFLARIRAKEVDKLIPGDLRAGRILDFGCGSYPYFLKSIEFKEKFGLDKSLEDHISLGLKIIKFDLEINRILPFPDNYFSVVTALAVAEHLSEAAANNLWLEIRRILMPGGLFILTTPAAETKGILDMMARLGLVSAEEIMEHQQFYTKKILIGQLQSAGFDSEKLRVRRFELGANLISAAKK